MADEKREYRKIDELHNWDKNPRSITEKGFERLKKQIAKLGQYKPLIVMPDGEVIGGNMRLRAYKELGIEEVWVSVVNPKDENEKMEIALSDNDRAGHYDSDLLANIMPEFNIEWEDYAVDLGEPTTLDSILQQEIEEDEPPALDTENEPESIQGEVYTLGRHKLMCGDSTNPEDVQKLLSGIEVDAVFTDPPYGVSYTGTNNPNGKEWDMIKNDDLRGDDLFKFLLETFKNMRKGAKRGAAFYVCYSSSNHIEFEKALSMAGITVKQVLIWDKGHVLGHSDYHWTHEPILYGKCTDGKTTWYGDRTQKTVLRKERKDFSEMSKSDLVKTLLSIKKASTILEIRKDYAGAYVHPTQKPVRLPATLIKNSTKEGDNILDLFGGSGSTLMAAEQTGRNAYIMELDRRYCDVIRKRYDKYKAEHET